MSGYYIISQIIVFYTYYIVWTILILTTQEVHNYFEIPILIECKLEHITNYCKSLSILLDISMNKK